MNDELAAAIAEYEAAAKRPWPCRALSRAEVRAEFTADLIKLRYLRDRIVILKKQRADDR